MNRLEFTKKNILEWREVDSPKITELNQVIVRPLVVSRCDLDLPILRGDTFFRPSFPIGHEFVAEVYETSEDLIHQFPKGQKVAVSFQIACGECNPCSSGQSKSCSSVPHTSGYGMGGGGKQFGGAMSDFVLVPFAKQMLLPIKDSTDLISIASINDNLIEAWKLAGIYLTADSNKTILVMGGIASSIGLYTVALAAHLGSPEIIYLDNNLDRMKIAEFYGAKVELIPTKAKRHSKRFQIVADASGTVEGWDFGLRSLDVDGNFGSASIYWTNNVPIPYLELYNMGANINLGRVKSVEWMPKMLHEIEENGFNPSRIVTKIAKWNEAPEAFLEEETKLVIVR